MVMLEARGPPDVRKSGGACALPRRGLVSCACRPTAAQGARAHRSTRPGTEGAQHTHVCARRASRAALLARVAVPVARVGVGCAGRPARLPCRSAQCRAEFAARAPRRARSLPRGARIHLDSDFSGYLSIKRTFYSARDAASTRERRFRFPDSAFSTPIPPLYTGTGPPTARLLRTPRL